MLGKLALTSILLASPVLAAESELQVAVNPPKPEIVCSAVAGTVVATISVSGGNGNPLTLKLTGDAAEKFAIKGDDIVVGPKGLSADGKCSGKLDISIEVDQK
jgi:hypothetical protein